MLELVEIRKQTVAGWGPLQSPHLLFLFFLPSESCAHIKLLLNTAAGSRPARISIQRDRAGPEAGHPQHLLCYPRKKRAMRKVKDSRSSTARAVCVRRMAVGTVRGELSSHLHNNLLAVPVFGRMYDGTKFLNDLERAINIILPRWDVREVDRGQPDARATAPTCANSALHGR